MTVTATPTKLSIRQGLGLVIVIAGVLCGIGQLVWLLQHNDGVRLALLAGLAAAAATAVGSLPVLFLQGLRQKLHDVMLGFGAGVMLSACMFSLIVPALAQLSSAGLSSWAGSAQVAAAVIAGAVLMLLLERLVPHQHFIKHEQHTEAHWLKIRRSWLFVFAIALHNLPEGLAIGAAFASGDTSAATALATGISLQDIPEGLVVAMALLSAGYSRVLACAIGILSGLTEPVMAVIGAALLGDNSVLLAWGLALAAGAMLFVISHEMIPESHRQGHELAATKGFMLGFVLMLLLDTALG